MEEADLLGSEAEGAEGAGVEGSEGAEDELAL